MKKLLLFGTAIGLGLSAVAQQNTDGSQPIPQASSELQVAAPKAQPLTGEETSAPNAKASQQPLADKIPLAAAPTETVIGVSTYDLQSNSALQNRIKNHGDGTVSCVWTYSESGDLDAPDRGTGYNFFDGTTWGAQPTARIENVRVGWPSNVANAMLGEAAIAHTVQEDINVTQRPNIGSGTWSESLIPGPKTLWPRSASNGNTIHSFSITTPVANGGTEYNGQDGALTYSRSLDGGATWDIQKIVPAGTDINFSEGYGGDGYAIAEPVGDTAAFAMFDQWQDGYILKTTDNGNTWSKIIFNDFPLDLYDGLLSDTNNDGMADTIATTDDAGAILLDHDGMAHIWYGNMNVLDDDPADGGQSFFPATNGLMYWNESFGSREPVMIAGAQDIDGNGVIDIVGNTIDGIASYFLSLSGQPSAGIADNGDIYVVYAAHMENLDQTVQNYRHLHAIRSQDGGCSWTEPLDLNSNEFFAECVFGSVAKLVDNNLHIVYQKDDEPGLSVRGDEDAFRENEIVYMSVPTTDFDAQPIAVCNTYVEGETSVCPGDSILLRASCGSAYQWYKDGAAVTGGTNDVVWADDAGTYHVEITTPCGVQNDTLVVVYPTTAPTFDVMATEDEICPGDTSMITASNVSGGGASYLWSTGMTTDMIAVTQPGTYTVTVTNCGGTSTSSYEIMLPSLPTATITGNDEICPGDSTELEAGLQPSASYLWSTGATTQTITANATGTYTVSVTNCGGTASTDFMVSDVPAPSAFVNQNGNAEFCEGAETVTLAALSGTTWEWSNAATTQSITLSATAESGSYTVTVFNECGVSATSASTDITIHPEPAQPTISQSSLMFTCNDTGSEYQWYINGIPLSGETGQTFTASTWSQIDAREISCSLTDANGCESAPSAVIIGIDGIESAGISSFAVYPNPNDGMFSVAFTNAEADKYTISVTNVLGQQVYTETRGLSGNQNVAIDLANFDKGMYFVTVTNSTSERTQRVVVK